MVFALRLRHIGYSLQAKRFAMTPTTTLRGSPFFTYNAISLWSYDSPDALRRYSDGLMPNSSLKHWRKLPGLPIPTMNAISDTV